VGKSSKSGQRSSIHGYYAVVSGLFHSGGG
jgi:hypothetical protein